jgi:hypothetical protein
MHYEQDQRNNEEHIGDVGGDSRNASYAKHTRNQRHDEKYHCVMEHDPLPFSSTAAERAFTSETEQKLCRIDLLSIRAI